MSEDQTIQTEETKELLNKIKQKLKDKMWWVDNIFLIALFALILYLALTGTFTDTRIIEIPIYNEGCAPGWAIQP